MSVSPIDVVFFAALAPIFGVILFWFIQLLFIESLKYVLSSISARHQPLTRFTNFLGIFFQTACHALGYTVTKSGIEKVHVSVDYGKVAPKKTRKGVGEWFANAFLFIGPFFIPALLLLIFLPFLMNGGFALASQSSYSFAEGLIIYGQNLYTFSLSFFSFLATIDLLHPAHLGFFLLLIILGLGIRPSYIGKKPRKKVDMLYDLKNIRYNVLHKPIYIFMFFLSAYLFFYISLLLQQDWYSILFSIFGWLSIISIVALLIAHIILFFIKTTDELPTVWRMLCFSIIPLSYIGIRSVFYVYPVPYLTSLSLIFMIVVTVLVTVFLYSRFTNTFKTSFFMNLLKNKKKRKDDGSRRVIRK